MRRHIGNGTAEMQLIMLSAATTARRESGASRARELAASADWKLIMDRLHERRLLPLLGPRLVELGDDRVGEGFALAVTQSLDASRRQAVLLQAIGERIMAALADAGIRCTALKGTTLSEALYGDPGRRQSSDIDLLVEPERLHDAVAVVRKLGYRAPIDHTDEQGLPLLHFALLHRDDQLPPVELHWRIHWYERSFACERLLAPSAGPGGAWRPAPIDELAALLLFYARDGFISLRHGADVAGYWDAFGATLEPGALASSIRAYPALAHALVVAAKVAERIVGLPADRLIAGDQELTKRDRIAMRLADPHRYTSEPQLYADMGLIDGLLAPPGGFRAFVKRQVIPSREVLREHAEKAQRPHADSTIGHGVRVLGRYGLAMARLLRTSKRDPVGIAS